MLADMITVEGDPQPDDALIRLVMKDGRRLAQAEPLAESRERAARQLVRLPQSLLRLRGAPAYPVHLAPRLQALVQQTDRDLRGG
jgi:nicotinate phosphoribosyltransferase